MTYYRLRPGVQHPAFRAGELYRLIEPTYPQGYVFVDLNGQPRCIDTRHFEVVETLEVRGGAEEAPITSYSR